MSWIRTLAIGATLLVVIGLGLLVGLGPAAIERSQNRVVEHPPWQVSRDVITKMFTGMCSNWSVSG